MLKPPALRRIVFDLDGTLVDTAPDLAAATNHVLTSIGRKGLPLDDVRHMVGQGARRLIELGLAATGVPARGDPPIETLLAMFIANYRANIARQSRPFPGAVAVLDALKASGIALGVCTNKPQELAEALLAALDLGGYFGNVVGGDCLAFRKPDPRHLLATLEPLGDGAALMIGDSIPDLEAARAAGIPVLLARFGYSLTPVEDLAADGCFDSFADLARLLGLEGVRQV